MVKFLKTTGISNEIEQLISNSKQQLYLITPYLQISPILKPLIRDLVLKIPTISFTVVCRSDKINAEDMEFFQDLKIVKVLALDNLHAKCYLNEDTAIITSMNLYQYSERNNYEMGIKIERNAEKDEYDQLFEYISIMLRESVKYEIKRVEKDVYPPNVKEQTQKSPSKTSQKQQEIKTIRNGHCIRCGANMEFNLSKPLCTKCYPIWAKYSDQTYPEKYCHICGKESNQSYAKPVCYSCYKKINK
jgi:phosphatidylserine/phosphatidylglycerophosphate/cardiolipin synthase-like enzyme